MNEYNRSEDKIAYFNGLSVSEQKNIFSSLSYEERKNILNGLSFSSVDRLLKEFQPMSSERRNILENISSSTLEAIYRNSSQDEKNLLREEIENIQANKEMFVQNRENEITNSSHKILDFNDNIVKSYADIASSKIKVSEYKDLLKNNKVHLKSISKDRKKLLRKVNKLVSKKESRLGIFNKRRINKLKNLSLELERVNGDFNRLREENHDLKNVIDQEVKRQETERSHIAEAKKNIVREKENIKRKSKEVQGKRVEIRGLDSVEKRIFGRKIYHDTSYLRNDIIATRKKKASLEVQKRFDDMKKMNQQKKDDTQNRLNDIKKNVEAKKDIEKNTNKSQENVDKKQTQDKDHQDKKEAIQNFNQVFQQFLNNGMRQLPMVSLNSNGNFDVPVTSVNMQQMVMLGMVMGRMYELGLQQAKQQMENSSLVDENGQVIQKNPTRVLKPHGYVSFSIIVAISIVVLFVVMLFLFK